MRIAICDDEDQERLNIEALVKRYAPELSIVLFSSADELLAAAKTTFFPLIFLDIDGTCGGYNLQWAWSSGAVAGRNAAKEEKK